MISVNMGDGGGSGGEGRDGQGCISEGRGDEDAAAMILRVANVSERNGLCSEAPSDKHKKST